MKIKTLLPAYIGQNHHFKLFFRIMKITFFLLFTCMFQLMAANANAQNMEIRVSSNKITIKELIQTIEGQTDYLVVYRNQDIDLNTTISFSENLVKVFDYLNELTKKADVNYSFNNNYITLSKKQNSVEQGASIKITGKVLDMNGEPIIGANITEQELPSNGTITDVDGNFTMNVTTLNTMLKISYIGYKTISIEAKKNLIIRLSEDSEKLEEVVIVGYTTQKKKLVTGSTIQVKGDEMQKLSSTDPVASIRSISPGVEITNNGANPGEGYKIYIRGIATMGNSAPLVIIDGLVGGNLEALAPSDIESIDVLKDAASSAIYGARAANGVIIVTTKKGKQGRTQISYDGYMGIQTVRKMLGVADAQMYVNLLNEIADYTNSAYYNYADLVPNWSDIENGRFKGTNWLKESENKNAPIQQHAININGGSDRMVYSVGFSYMNQEALFGEPKPLNYSRYTARINTEYILLQKGDLDFVKFGENILFNDQVRKGPAGRLSLRTVVSAPPFLPVRDENGEYSKATTWWNQYEPNPIGNRDLGSGDQTTNNLSLHAGAFVEIQPIKNLKFKSQFTFDYAQNSTRAFYPKYDLGASSMTRSNDEISQSQSYSIGYILENTLNYLFTLNTNKGRHNFDVLLGQAIQKSGLGSSINGKNVDPILTGLDYAYLDNSASIISGKTTVGGSPMGRHQIASFFGRINYDFNETYLASLVLRTDGSSNFARGHRWGWFPSVSAGWVISNENWLEPTKSWLDFLKVRASWGQNGNEDVTNFQYLATIRYNQNYFFGTSKNVLTPGAYYDILPNEKISWEKSEQFDLGLDARFLNQRLGFTFDYYIKDTKDWLVKAPSLSSNGTGTPYINGGDIRNSGVELGLTWNDQIKDFRYGVSTNFSYNNNKVTRIGNGTGYIQGSTGGDLYRAEEGYPLGYFRGYPNAGIFQNQEEINAWIAAGNPVLSNVMPGDIKWIDTNRDKALNQNDITMLGSPHPKYRFGLNLNFEYKGFDFAFAGYGVAGNKIYQSYRSWPDLEKVTFTSNYYESRWHGEGTSNHLPRFTNAGHQNWTWNSTQFILDGSFFRADNITIGYDFAKIWRHNILKQLRFYFTIQNMFCITSYSGMDPEIGYGGDNWGLGLDYMESPRPRTYLMGVNIKF